jgi:hypothetical protein
VPYPKKERPNTGWFTFAWVIVLCVLGIIAILVCTGGNTADCPEGQHMERTRGNRLVCVQ